MSQTEPISLQDLNRVLEQFFDGVDLSTLQLFAEALEENAPAVQAIAQNALDKRIPPEEQAQLLKPLQPKPYKPPRKAPPKPRRAKRKAILEEFDPVPAQRIRAHEDYQSLLQRLLNRAQEADGTTLEGRRFITWAISSGLKNNLTNAFMDNIRNRADTAFYLRHNYSYWLENIEDGTMIEFHHNPKIKTPWIQNLSEAEEWLNKKEEERLVIDNIERPDTKWVFRGFSDVYVKVIFTRQPLLGTGSLPDWLRNIARGYAGPMAALDTFRDNLCLWRCIAVHRGARLDRCTAAARELAKSYFNLEKPSNDVPKTYLNELDAVENHLNRGAAFSNWLGIRVYEPERGEDNEVVWTLRRNPSPKLTNILTIGIYEGHAFYIKNISKLAKTYVCTHCYARFTQAVSLQRHNQTCARGETVIECRGEKVEAPQTVFEEAFYPEHNFSNQSILWIEQQARRYKTHIHHALCGHGGERWFGSPVDGYHPRTRTIFQYHGCYWHGCRECYPNGRNIIQFHKEQTLEDRFLATQKFTQELREAGYKVIEGWSCKVGKLSGDIPKVKTKSYPYAIFYDFEAYGDKSQRKKLTEMLTVENVHVPISVSIGDTLEREPTHFCERDPAELICKFMEELERRGKNIRTKVCEEFKPQDLHRLTKAQREKINKWCDQVPVVGFNSGSYDINLIRNHFAEHLADTTDKVRVAKKGNKIMFILTKGFRFLDIINYLGPGTSYEEWVKAYSCTAEKSWLPYEWFDSPEKLDYPGLPDYPEWYSRLKESFPLKLSEWKACKRLFKARGMGTFADWLKYYNNLDVAPGLEALEKMRAFYTEKEIDILKDAASIPGVSLHYLLRGSIDRGAELYSPDKEAYKMLKEAVVGGPSLVFTRYHEVGVTKIRSHQYKDARLCKTILGYDANALYLSTMLSEMPCGKETVVHYQEEEEEEEDGQRRIVGNKLALVRSLVRRLKEGKWFGFAEVDIEIPEPLHPKFEALP